MVELVTSGAREIDLTPKPYCGQCGRRFDEHVWVGAFFGGYVGGHDGHKFVPTEYPDLELA